MTDNKKDKPLVAIRCIVYNHEPYLRDCLEGFVMQKTNFRFVAVVLFPDAVERTRVEKLYALLCQQRHRIFHFDSLTPILLSKNDALDILDQTLKTINDAY